MIFKKALDLPVENAMTADFIPSAYAGDSMAHIPNLGSKKRNL
jgi:hypothetical protein